MKNVLKTKLIAITWIESRLVLDRYIFIYIFIYFYWQIHFSRYLSQSLPERTYIFTYLLISLLLCLCCPSHSHCSDLDNSYLSLRLSPSFHFIAHWSIPNTSVVLFHYFSCQTSILKTTLKIILSRYLITIYYNYLPVCFLHYYYYYYYYYFGCTGQHVGSQCSDQRSNLHPRALEGKVLTTGLPQKSLYLSINNRLLWA